MESQNCFVLPAPDKRDSQPAQKLYGFVLLKQNNNCGTSQKGFLQTKYCIN